MLRRLSIAVAVLAVLPAAAQAKEVQSLTVCGTDGCSKVGSASDRRQIENGGDTGPPTKAAAFVRVRAVIKAGDARDVMRSDYLPALGLLRAHIGENEVAWIALGSGAVRVLDRAARGHRMFPASRLGPINPTPGARVDEVYQPAPQPVADDGGAPVWPWFFVVLVPGVLVFVARRRRRPRPVVAGS